MNKINYKKNPKLEQQLNFIIEVDKVKDIFRKTKIFNGSRFENDGEHSWTICLMAVLLKEYSNFEINLEKVLTMLLIHDIVEIDAGDTFLYSKNRDSAQEKEKAAAHRIFGLLEEKQKQSLIDLWEEFEERKSKEAQFASIFDRLEPLLQNFLQQGYSWKKYKVTYKMVIEKNKHIQEASQEIWEFVLAMLDEAVEKKYLEKS